MLMTLFAPNPNRDRFYLTYLRDDPAKEQTGIGYSTSGVIADACRENWTIPE
jgi:hypothetical protein